MKNYRYKQCGVWLVRREPWQLEEWTNNGNEGLPPDGIVDCISSGSQMAYAFDDYTVLEVHEFLLINGKRWPETLTPPGNPKMRSINSMTRDPYLNFWFACFKMDKTEYIDSTPLPWWLRRRYAVAWRQFVLTKNPYYKARFEKYLKRLIWWGRNTDGIRKRVHASRFKLIRQLHHRFGINGYSLELWCQMAHCADSWGVKQKLVSILPGWNYYLWLLMGRHYATQESIREFIPQRRNLWTSLEYYDDKPLEEGDEYPLDKMLLIKLKS